MTKCSMFVTLQVKKEKPDIAFGEVGKVLGQKWKSISEKDKTKYEELAAKDKERYEKEKKAYDAKSDD